MSLSGSTKKIILDLSQWKKAMTLRVLSPDLLDSLKLSKVDFQLKNQLSNLILVVLKEEGRDFMHSEHLGWILTCPSNLGTGLRAGSMVKIPLFSARKDFKDVCGKMGLQVRGTKGIGGYDQTKILTFFRC